MRRFKNTAAAILTGALALSITSCSINSDPSDTTNKIVNPSVSVGLSSEAKKPSDGLSKIAAVNYADHELSEADDLKTLEQKIETKYGVDIVYGGDIRTEFGDESEQLVVEKYTDEANIKKALASVDNILKIYPKTFFYQLRLSEDNPLKIYLTGHIKSLTYPDASINAFTSDTDSKGEFYLVIDIAGQSGIFNPPDVMHEIVHLTDFKLRSLGLMKSEDWAKLNPEGFAYRDKTNADAVMKYNFAQAEYCPRTDDSDISGVYFVCPYSQANEFEDRATLLTNAMIHSIYNYEVEPGVYKCPHLQAKMEFWFSQVRKGFDTTYWENIPWEDSYSKLK